MTIKRMPVSGIAEAEPSRLSARGGLAGERSQARLQSRRQRHRALNASDGTVQLLVSGSWTMLVGLVAGALTLFAFGGVGRQGAHSNPGWLSLMVAMMATPFAILLLLLGGAKWLRNYSLSKDPLPR